MPRDMWEWFKEHAEGVAMWLFLMVLAGALYAWAQHPSSFARSHYNDCLETVLRHGTINDAEVMCAHSKKEAT